MPAPNVKIISRRPPSTDNGIEIDGARIPGVHTVSLRTSVRETPRVVIELWASEIEADIDDATVVLTPDHIRQLVTIDGVQDVSALGDRFRQYQVSEQESFNIERIVEEVLARLRAGGRNE